VVNHSARTWNRLAINKGPKPFNNHFRLLELSLRGSTSIGWQTLEPKKVAISIQAGIDLRFAQLHVMIESFDRL